MVVPTPAPFLPLILSGQEGCPPGPFLDPWKPAKLVHYELNSADWRTGRQHADYTSACLTTKGLQGWQYGRFEMRGRIDTRSGLWPAFWTLGATGEWPRCGELDIMEYYRGLLANVAWDETSIHLSVDGLPLNTVDLTQTVNQDSAGKNSFHQPHYLLLNLAVGGMNGGDPSTTEFPARFEVDYVRVYQKANG
jgi:beta-glucanase (GH16 family)